MGQYLPILYRNPRGGGMRALDIEDMNSLGAYMKEHNFGTLLAHAPYTYNPCAAKEDLRAFAKQSMKGRFGAHGIFTWSNV